MKAQRDSCKHAATHRQSAQPTVARLSEGSVKISLNGKPAQCQEGPKWSPATQHLTLRSARFCVNRFRTLTRSKLSAGSATKPVTLRSTATLMRKQVYRANNFIRHPPATCITVQSRNIVAACPNPWRSNARPSPSRHWSSTSNLTSKSSLY